ncbi:MAG: PSD1 and planctomycete cytochrome C domain-containing protein [Armatimonadota bacterium]
MKRKPYDRVNSIQTRRKTLRAVGTGALFSAPVFILMALSSLTGNASPPQTVTFNRDIRPILSENCFYCHGPDKTHQQAGLRLDLRDAAIRVGALVPGKPEASKLITRIFTSDENLRMPPDSSHKTLTTAQKNTLTQWIKEGARYEAHWAYIPARRPLVPKIAGAKNPIDAFVLAQLAEKKLKPSAQADRRTLIRRVSLDLTGLPPTSDAVRAFVNDKSPNAYEKLVDRLLASPQYGERMAVPWLDVVRYADTVGFHGDQNQNAWAYRDYVINAFNKNKPFDKFTIEQIAGDLLPNPTTEQRTATAFNRLNMVTREGGAQAKEYLTKYADDRVRTVSMAFLGSTVGCAQCHDHKFDPISQKDFYALGAFFADVKQWGVYADYGYTPNPDLKGYNNDYPFPPEITVSSAYLQRRIAHQRKRIDQVAAETQSRLQSDPAARTAFADWCAKGKTFLASHPDGWDAPERPTLRTLPAKAGDAVPSARVEPNGSILLARENKAPGTLEISLKPTVSSVAALRVEALPHAAHQNSVFRTGMKAATLTLSAALHRADGGKPQPIRFRYAGANIAEPRYSNGFEILGVHRGWKLSSAHKSKPQTAVWVPEKPIAIGAGDTLTVTLPGIAVGCVRLATSPFVPDDLQSPVLPVTNLAKALSGPDAPASRALARRAYLRGTGWEEKAFDRVTVLEADILASRDGRTPVLVTEATKPTVTRLLPRGNWQDDSGPIVQPAVLHFLPQPKEAGKRRLTRLDLAQWLVSPENPLTARVVVNRFWKQFFGNGISGLVEDFGAQGEWPTHPELLDWLAVEFQESGWDVKHMVRLIVTSATYRQSSSLRPDLRDADPNNRLLASQNPRRLDAEFVRDNALAIAGLLNREEGGPPVKPYQPAGYYASIQFPSRDYDTSADERQWRRGVYMHWQRTFLHPMLANFDAPSREDCIASRNVANTPQQALTLLNDPQFVEAARVFAAHLLTTPAPSDSARLENAFQRALGRPIKARESASLLAFLKTARGEYAARPEDAAKLRKVGQASTPSVADDVELAAWTSVCRVILNLNETITRY